MMRWSKLACIVGLATLGTACHSVSVTARPAAHRRVATPGALRGALSPYGEWVVVNGYGQVWRPLVTPSGWTPYTHGTWTWIDDAWVWRSDFDWGWAAFHYGRWYPDPLYGWVWVPGSQWGPAWVSWSYANGYVGWSPLGPVGWRRGQAGWCFIERRHFGRRHVRRVMVRPAEARRLVRTTKRHTSPAPPTRASAAPKARRARTGRAAPARPAVSRNEGSWSNGSSFSRGSAAPKRARVAPKSPTRRARGPAVTPRRAPSKARSVAPKKAKVKAKKEIRVKAKPRPARKMKAKRSRGRRPNRD